MPNTVVFYHAYLFSGTPPDLLPNAFNVVADQMKRLKTSGLADAASEIIIGLNGGEESREVMSLIAPEKAKIVLHGLESKCENPTIVVMEEWLKANLWESNILYFHAKGSSHDPATHYGDFDRRWRERMMFHCVDNWRQCMEDLKQVEAVGAHWLTGQGHDHSQHYFAGTFWWCRASFLRTIPSIMTRERIKMSGIGAAESRYEAEVVLGNGPRLPVIKNYYAGSIGT